MACDFRQVAVYQKDITRSIEVAIIFALINNFAIARYAMRCLARYIA